MHVLEENTLSDSFIKSLIDKAVTTNNIKKKENPIKIIIKNLQYGIIFWEDRRSRTIATITYNKLNITKEYICDKSMSSIVEYVDKKMEDVREENNRLAKEEMLNSFSLKLDDLFKSKRF